MLNIMRKFLVNAVKSSSLCNKVNFFPNFDTSSVSTRNHRMLWAGRDL